MEPWTEALSDAFLPVEWFCSSTTSTNLLIKLLYRREPRELALLATDLHGVFYESLNGRQLNRRIDDAVASSPSDTQAESIGVMAGVGDEGEELVVSVLEELVDAVKSGRARAELREEGFEQFVDVTLPSETVFRFVLFKLETESAQVLASHLIQPLLGTSSALLSLLRQDTTNEEALVAKLEPAIDSSGRAERLSQGKNCSIFFRVGGAGLLKRWEQSLINPKTKRNDPLKLSLPAPGSFATIPRQPVPSTSKQALSLDASPPPSSSSRRKSGLVSKMFDHRSKSAGERIGWDDTQMDDPPPRHTSKGKERALEGGLFHMVDPAGVDEPEEEEEPATDEDAEVVSQAESTLRQASLDQDNDHLRPPSPPPRSSPNKNRRPSPSLPLSKLAGSRGPPANPNPPLPSQEDIEAKKAKKKRKAEEEENEALERRKAKIAMLKAGPALAPKKKRGGTRGL
ncbi:hypothetical protein JCM16303_005986 [Sporobolomyces ruberrimus]